jgi:predicted nucleotidyltransferase
LVTDTSRGRERLLQANAAHPSAEPLARLLEITAGARQVIAEEFGHISGMDKVLIFGSWAFRYRGEPGHSPHDVAVLVVGDTADRADAYAAADRAEAMLGLQVNQPCAPTLNERIRPTGSRPRSDAGPTSRSDNRHDEPLDPRRG